MRVVPTPRALRLHRQIGRYLFVSVASSSAEESIEKFGGTTDRFELRETYRTKPWSNRLDPFRIGLRVLHRMIAEWRQGLSWRVAEPPVLHADSPRACDLLVADPDNAARRALCQTRVDPIAPRRPVQLACLQLNMPESASAFQNDVMPERVNR